MPLPDATVRDFTPGQLTTADEGSLPAGAARRVLNLKARREDRSLRLVGGMSNLIATRPNPVVDFLRYSDPETGDKRLVFVEKSGGAAPFTYTVYELEESTGVATNLGNFLAYSTPPMVQVGALVFIASSNGTLNYWPGIGYTLRSAGMVAPVIQGVVALNGAGVLDSTNGSPYFYYHTNIDEFGNESNPSPQSPEISANNNTIRYTINAAEPPVNQTKYGIYRGGGLNRTIRKVAEVNYTGALINYDDNTADIDLSLTQLEFTHDTPPGGFRTLVHHKNRLWASGVVGALIGSPVRLWFSNYNEYHYWPRDTDGSGLSGGWFAIDENAEDHIVGLSSIESLLIVHRRYSKFAVYGDVWGQFRAVRISDEGTIARDSIAREGGVNYSLGTDGHVFRTGESGDEEISMGVETTLNAIPEALLENAAGHAFDDFYFLSVPNAGGVGTVLVYDMSTKAWFEALDEDDLLFHAVSVRSFVPPGGGRKELLVAPVAGYEDATGTPYNGVVRAWDDTVVVREIEWQSDLVDFGLPDNNTRFAGARIFGSLTAPGDPVVLTAVTHDKEGTVFTSNYNVTTGNGILFDRELDLRHVGVKHSLRLKGPVSACRIRAISLVYSDLGAIKR